MMDRISPTRRPSHSPSGYQLWRSLLFLHWRVPVDSLRPLVPDALSLDLWEGDAYVGVVPFLMRAVRPAWLPSQLAFNFLETNVRTYVHCEGRPGVFFFSLEAESRLAVWAARLGWGLPYHFARMKFQRQGDEHTYETRRADGGASHRVRYQPGEHLGPSQPETIEHFLLERYLLFVPRGGRLLYGQVHHQPYPVQLAKILQVDDQLQSAAGLPRPTEPPCLAHYAEGVDVEVFALRECRTRQPTQP